MVRVCIVSLQLNESNERKIMLKNMDFEASGTYSCEVSTQTPIYTKPSNDHELSVIRKCTFRAQSDSSRNHAALLTNPLCETVYHLVYCTHVTLPYHVYIYIWKYKNQPGPF
jgi:hypothetical protein